MSKLVTVAADGANTAVVADATLTDVFSSLLSTDKAITGMYKYLQVGIVGLATAAYMNKRHTGSFTNFGG